MIAGILQDIMSRDAAGAIQFLKYALCGGLATGVDVLIFYSLSWRLIPALKRDDFIARLLRLKIHPVEEGRRGRNFVINTAIAFMFSNFVAYISNVLWVFEPGRHAWYIEISLFYAVSLISISLGAFLGWAMIHYLKLSTTVSYIGKLIGALVVNFVCRKFIIFKG